MELKRTGASCVDNWQDVSCYCSLRCSWSVDEKETVGLAFVLCSLFLVLGLVNEA